jgi:DNA-directed RNA polymerase subunit RPC12/RpoP
MKYLENSYQKAKKLEKGETVQNSETLECQNCGHKFKPKPDEKSRCPKCGSEKLKKDTSYTDFTEPPPEEEPEEDPDEDGIDNSGDKEDDL